MDRHVQRCTDAAEQRINFLLEEEQEPFTMNNQNFMDYRSKFLGYYKGIRQKSQSTFITNLESNQHNMNVAISNVTSSLAQLGLHSVTASSLPRLLPLDPMESAIEIMAEVRAYFQGTECPSFFFVQARMIDSSTAVAYKRFVDSVPMTIDHALVRGMKVGLESVLFNGVDISGPGGYERCKVLLGEPEDIIARREEMQKRRERLVNGRRELLQAFE
jgi:Dynamin GTPase effector domain